MRILIDILSLYILSNPVFDVSFIALVILGNTAVARDIEKIEIGRINIRYA